MSREALHESLSAVMDNEADELELRRVLAGDNPELRATWSRYQLARAAMHKELIEPRLDIAAAVSAALADEAKVRLGGEYIYDEKTERQMAAELAGQKRVRKEMGADEEDQDMDFEAIEQQMGGATL